MDPIRRFVTYFAAARYEGGGEEAFANLLYAPEMHDPDLVTALEALV